MDTVWRLTWALPLVLMTGIAAMLILRRFLARTQRAAAPTSRMSARESLSLSDCTRVHLIEVDGRSYLVVESLRQAALQPAPQDEGTRRPAMRFGPSWIQRFHKGGPR